LQQHAGRSSANMPVYTGIEAETKLFSFLCKAILINTVSHVEFASHTHYRRRRIYRIAANPVHGGKVSAVSVYKS
jgi:hypothetical protein